MINEVISADGQSNDNTVKLVNEFIRNSGISIKLLSIEKLEKPGRARQFNNFHKRE